MSAVACGTSSIDSALPDGPYPDPGMPGDIARLFSPGFINTGMITRDVAMTPAMDELYFSVSTLGYKYATIMVTKKANGVWTKPEVAPHMDDFRFTNFEPFISPDGKKMFFLSTRPDPAKGEETGDQDIWVMDRDEDAWGEPYNLGEPISSEAQEYYPSVTKDGTLYFTRFENGANFIYRSRIAGGSYLEPEKLPVQVNTGTARFNASISPDEDHIIVPAAGKEESIGGSTDYYIVFRDEDDNWSEPVNMGEKINTGSNQEFSAYISPDKQAFFFMSARLIQPNDIAELIPDKDFTKLYSMPETGNSNIYWIKADIIDELRRKAVFK